MGPEGLVLESESTRSAEKILSQLQSVIDDFSKEYPQHTRSIPIPRPGEDPLIAFVRSMAQSMANKEKQLERLHEQALETVKAEQRFLANMSHEVRTPMNAIFGLVALLLEMDLSPVQRDYIETIHGESELLLNVINDILDLSKISAKKLVLRSRVFQIRKILEDILLVHGPVAEKKGLRLTGSVDASLSEIWWGDDLRLKQILSNLVSNAVKFVEKGAVSIDIFPENREDPDCSTILFTVKDSGIGISEEDGKTLFDPFAQAEHFHNQGGTGLGLAICKNLVELMQGEIWFESTPGKGTTFYVSVCLEKQEPVGGETMPMISADADGNSEKKGKEMPGDVALGSLNQPEGKSRQVLVVEDNPVNQKVARLSLEKLGCGVFIANNGEEAVQLATEGGKFDLICMDVNMPVMSGLEATKRIRQLEGPNSNARILAVTGLAFEDDRQRCLESGMDDFITKPFSIDDFRKQLLSLQEEDIASGEIALSS